MNTIKDWLSNPRFQQARWGLAVVAVTLILVGPDTLSRIGQHDRTWEHVRESGVVRFGMEASYAPFEALTTSGELFGLDVDLARELAGRMGARAEFVMVGSDGFYDALTSKQCDAIISALISDGRRTTDFRYTRPYFDAGLVFIVPAAGPERIGSDLTGKTIAVERGSEGDTRAEWLARRTVGLHMLTFETPAEAMQAVEVGQADGALTDTVAARQLVAAHPGLRMGPRQTSLTYAMAVRADAPTLLGKLNQALKEVQDNGALERILSKWVDEPG